MLDQIKQSALEKIEQSQTVADLEEIYRQFLGRKGKLADVFKTLKDLSVEEKKQTGAQANQARQAIEQALEEKKGQLKEDASSHKEWLDVTAPSKIETEGHLHPLTQLRRQVEEIFQSMGFHVAEGDEVETEYYNFDALNIPANHPARDLWDTLWLKQLTKDKKKLLLRTHTSPMQIHHMEANQPPIRVIAPGRCFRYEATDATHDVQFHQVEALMIDKNISVANFKGIIDEFSKRFFGSDTQTRLRPSYFPFTEPSFEIDVKTKNGRWMELFGAGMVHPNVLKAVKYDPNKWQGFAFGLGLDRLALTRYKIDDIRLFYGGDLRFLKQF